MGKPGLCGLKRGALEGLLTLKEEWLCVSFDIAKYKTQSVALCVSPHAKWVSLTAMFHKFALFLPHQDLARERP